MQYAVLIFIAALVLVAGGAPRGETARTRSALRKRPALPPTDGDRAWV